MERVSDGFSRFVNLVWDLGFVWFFLRVILDPTAFSHFLYRMGFSFIMIEFITIHSTMFFFGFGYGKVSWRASLAPFAGLFLFYSMFAGAAAWAAKSVWIFLYFWFSTFVKVFDFMRGDEGIKTNAMGVWGFTTVIFLFSAFISLIFLQPAAGVLAGGFGYSLPDPSWDELAHLAGDEKSSVSGSPPEFLAYWIVTYFALQVVGDVFGGGLKKRFQVLQMPTVSWR